MPKFLKSNFFWLFYTIGLTIASFRLFFLWGVMVGTLFGLFWLFRLTGFETKLTAREHRLYLLTVMLYPLAESAVQWAGIVGWFPRDFTLINRGEHLCWAAALSLMFLPLHISIWRRLNRWQGLLFMLGFVCLLGNLNEFLEYLTRLSGAGNHKLFATFYSDTMLDMTMNLFGGFVGFFLLNWVTAPRQLDQ
jgi:hypothetical protein